MFYRPKPIAWASSIAQLKSGEYILIHLRRWARDKNGPKQWVYDGKRVEIFFSPPSLRSGSPVFSVPERDIDRMIVW